MFMTNQRSPETPALHQDPIALHPDAAALLAEAHARRLDALARRFDDLERQNRRLTLILLGAVVLVAAVGANAQVAPAAVTGDRFVLVDAQNRTRASLENATPTVGAGRYPVLTFMDGAGRSRLRLGLGPRGALLEVIDESGKARDYFGPFAARPLTQP
jgi:hypothetical protein